MHEFQAESHHPPQRVTSRTRSVMQTRKRENPGCYGRYGGKSSPPLSARRLNSRMTRCRLTTVPGPDPDGQRLTDEPDCAHSASCRGSTRVSTIHLAVAHRRHAQSGNLQAPAAAERPSSRHISIRILAQRQKMTGVEAVRCARRSDDRARARVAWLRLHDQNWLSFFDRYHR